MDVFSRGIPAAEYCKGICGFYREFGFGEWDLGACARHQRKILSFLISKK
jgi:hypothetical protein